MAKSAERGLRRWAKGLTTAGAAALPLVVVSSVTFAMPAAPDAAGSAQTVEADIARHRMGTLTVLARPGDPVKVEQVRHDFWFGAAISNGLAGRMPEADLRQYKKVFLENFNAAVTENAVKWAQMERNRGEVNYADVDAILAWTEENHIPLRAHNLYWGVPQFVQPWVKKLGDSELRVVLQNRALTVASRYRGRFAEYDLNNEMIHGNYYEERLGPGITMDMARWAREGDPGIKLFLNDYEILTGVKLPEYIAHIRTLISQGVPIAGIGAQGHLHAESFDRDQLRRSLDALAVFGLPIRVTEFNMPGQLSKYYREKITTMTAQEEEQKARDIVDYYSICFAHPAVEGILMWGFWEEANWIPVSSLYRRDWSPTPAAIAYKDLLFKKWWTTASGAADANGVYRVPAFYGKYKVTVGDVTREVDMPRTIGSLTVDFRTGR